MNIDKKLVPEVKTLNWKVERDAIILEINNDVLFLNKTVKIVLEEINGLNSIDEIIKIVTKNYGGNDSNSDIPALVEETIEMLVTHSIVFLRSADEIDGWLKYE